MENAAYGYCPPYRGWHGDYRRHFRVGSAPVNIEETGDAYVLKLFAPALEKEKFSVVVHNDILYIRYDGSREVSSARFTRREYDPGSFRRSFRLKGKVEVDRIGVSYSEGILTVTLPRSGREASAR